MNDLLVFFILVCILIVVAIYFFNIENRNSATNFLNFVKTLVPIGITGLFIVFVWNKIESFMYSGNKTTEFAHAITSEISNMEFTIYEDANVSGSEVLNLIKRYDGKDEIAIIVTIVGASNTVSTCYCRGITYVDGVASYNDSIPLGKISDAKDITKTYQYINPTKQFSGTVLRDGQNNVAGLHFELDH